MRITSFSRSLSTHLALLVTIVALGACGISPPQRQPVARSVEVQPEPATLPAATVTPLEQAVAATSPWDYIKLARNAGGEQRQRYTLDAIEGFLDLGQSATARTLLEQLDDQPLSQIMGIRKQLLLARSYFIEQDFSRVESLLRPLASMAGLDADNAEQIMLLRAQARAAGGEPGAALVLLTQREPLLRTEPAIEENQDAVWGILSTLESSQLAGLRSDGSRQILAQWAELAIMNQQLGWNPHALREQMRNWQQVYPSHPASRSLIPRLLTRLGDDLAQYRKVALLLPLTSGFGAAAQAVYDGFSMMYEADSNPRKPQVVLYDTGENAELISFYYQAAIRDGAELVLGPLGKVAVDALVAGTELSVPTLLLGNTDASHSGLRNVFQFGLSPEDESRQVARRAFAEGHRVAAILYPETDWGQRQLESFASQWEALGGVIGETNVYQASTQDHSQTIKLMLNLDESETRHRRLQRLVGVDLEFVAKRRDDLDFIFAIARSDQARLLKPQINYHKGQDLPVFASSQVYSARNETIKDADLDGVIFGDMPWLLKDSGATLSMREELPEANKYLNDPLDRLFALGIDTYQLLFRLEAMRINPLLEFEGATGWLSLAPDGSIVRRLQWAHIDEGEVKPVGWLNTLVQSQNGMSR